MREFPLIILLIFIACSGNAQHLDFKDRSFNKADSIAKSYDGASLKDPEALADKLVVGLDNDVDKFRVIFRWITNNVSYDGKLYNELTSHIRSNKKLMTFSRRAYAKAMKEKSTVCIGYSYVLQQMCARVGIECEIVVGYPRTEGSKIGSGAPIHSWNAVRLNNKWYLCDPTWASGGYIEPVFFRQFDDQYFLSDPDLFRTDHYPTEEKWMLTSTALPLREFLNAPIKQDGFREFLVNQYYPQKGILHIKKGEEVRFRFTSNYRYPLQNARVWYWLNGVCESFYSLSKDGDGFYIIKQGFMDSGKFRVFIDVGGEPTFVYEVNVR